MTRSSREGAKRWILGIVIAAFAVRGAVAVVQTDHVYASVLGLVLLALGWLWLSD